MGLAPNPSNVILTQYLNGWWSTRPELNAGSHMVAGVCVLYMSILTWTPMAWTHSMIANMFAISPFHLTDAFMNVTIE